MHVQQILPQMLALPYQAAKAAAVVAPPCDARTQASKIASQQAMFRHTFAFENLPDHQVEIRSDQVKSCRSCSAPPL